MSFLRDRTDVHLQAEIGDSSPAAFTSAAPRAVATPRVVH
jgi:hypothetical protein